MQTESPLSARWRNAAVFMLVLLAVFSMHLAINRIFQVDECQNVYMSRIVALHETGTYFTNGTLFILGPMSWIAAHTSSSAMIYTWDRLLFLGVFWGNLVLIALNTGVPLRSRAFLLVLLGAGTLAPLWDYGFEIRHDNVLLLLLLGMWWVVRRARWRPEAAFALLGALSVLAQCVSFKAFLYWLPLSLAALLVPPASLRAPRGRRLLWWVLGAAGAGLLASAAYGATGTLGSFLNGFRTSVGHSENPDRFAPWTTLGRLPAQMPLVTAMAAGLLVAAGLRIGKTRLAALTWEGPLPEAALLLGSLAILLINPVPYPYNLVLLVPFAFLAAFQWVPTLGRLLGTDGMPALAGSVLVFTHLVPFAVQTARHLDFTNDRQEQLMDLAESLTDPAKDRVYDGAGLVATRESIHYQWFLHSLVMPKIASGQLPPVRDMIAANPPSVILASYRTDWLSPEDQTYITQHYVPLADDFYVLGASLPEGGGSFECLHPGRYQIALQAQVTGPGALPQVDGRPADGPVELAAGLHRITVPVGVKAAVIWLGPHLAGLRLPSAADHRALFVNWY
ncbi:MAG TPA: hypothetical protein VFT46_00995 [Holophagaceae bacterium]|nr:hypothetical protein [Holophagaceae bacterium]